MKNYVIRFMDKNAISLTAEEASRIARDWQSGGGLVLIKGNLYATHQICSITRVSKQEEKDLCSLAGISFSDVPTIEKFLTQHSNQKQLHA